MDKRPNVSLSTKEMFDICKIACDIVGTLVHQCQQLEIAIENKDDMVHVACDKRIVEPLSVFLAHSHELFLKLAKSSGTEDFKELLEFTDKFKKVILHK